MTITAERMQQIANCLANIKLLLSTVKWEELQEIIDDASRDEAIGPLMDPTRWRDIDLFSQTTKMKKVLRVMIELKKELEKGGKQ